MGFCPPVHGPSRDVSRRNVQGAAGVHQGPQTIYAICAVLIIEELSIQLCNDSLWWFCACKLNQILINSSILWDGPPTASI